MSDAAPKEVFPNYADPIDLLQFRPLHFSTYEDWKELRAGCPNCGWVGYLGQAPFELFRECAQVDCPQCPNTLAVISYPTRDEAVAAGDDSTVALYDYQRSRREAFEHHKLQSVDQLPDITDAEFMLRWTGHEKLGEEKYLELQYKETVIHREPMFFEDGGRYREICLILKQKYGDRLKDVLPNYTGWLYLGGDDSRSLSKAEDSRFELFGKRTTREDIIGGE
jgi:hypothetical protein